jgi:AcrR family transcriptional regulator
MQDICGEAGMSPGNLYRYFESKEALIAGICERNRADAVESFSLADNAPEFFEGLAGLARHHLVDRSDDEVALCAEIMAESRRHPEIAKLYQSIEGDIKGRIATMLRRAAERGEIRPDVDFDSAASVLMVLGDGMSWRRSVDPKFDAESALPMILQMVHCLLAKPKDETSACDNTVGVRS